ncbi:MAG: hypothetical protein ACI4PW_09485 [Alphaproteobacteria bacterium]|jgi:hypothetical protein
MTETPTVDPVRQEFIDMYEETLVDALEARNGEVSEDEERLLRIDAMVDVAMRVRKDLDPLLATKLKSLENLKDYKQYLLSEFKIFGFVSRHASAHVFAEYLLMSVMDEFEAEDIIDFSYLGDELNKAYAKASPEYQNSLRDLRRIFPWGSLID